MSPPYDRLAADHAHNCHLRATYLEANGCTYEDGC
jgi:hypothetical protein